MLTSLVGGETLPAEFSDDFSSLISSALVVVEWLLQTAAANLSATFVAPTVGYYVVNGEVESLFLLHI